MTNEQILKKAIEKAEKNGFNIFSDNMFPNWDQNVNTINDSEVYFLIFSHDFAKAFWGEEPYLNPNVNATKKEFEEYNAWSWHLQQMVLEKEPLKYIEKFL